MVSSALSLPTVNDFSTQAQVQHGMAPYVRCEPFAGRSLDSSGIGRHRGGGEHRIQTPTIRI